MYVWLELVKVFENSHLTIINNKERGKEPER
jgi:hypothetical protein